MHHFSANNSSSTSPLLDPQPQHNSSPQQTHLGGAFNFMDTDDPIPFLSSSQAISHHPDMNVSTHATISQSNIEPSLGLNARNNPLLFVANISSTNDVNAVHDLTNDQNINIFPHLDPQNNNKTHNKSLSHPSSKTSQTSFGSPSQYDHHSPTTKLSMLANTEHHNVRPQPIVPLSQECSQQPPQNCPGMGNHIDQQQSLIIPSANQPLKESMSMSTSSSSSSTSPLQTRRMRNRQFQSPAEAPGKDKPVKKKSKTNVIVPTTSAEPSSPLISLDQKPAAAAKHRSQENLFFSDKKNAFWGYQLMNSKKQHRLDVLRNNLINARQKRRLNRKINSESEFPSIPPDSSGIMTRSQQQQQQQPQQSSQDESPDQILRTVRRSNRLASLQHTQNLSDTIDQPQKWSPEVSFLRQECENHSSRTNLSEEEAKQDKRDDPNITTATTATTAAVFSQTIHDQSLPKSQERGLHVVVISSSVDFLTTATGTSQSNVSASILPQIDTTPPLIGITTESTTTAPATHTILTATSTPPKQLIEFHHLAENQHLRSDNSNHIIAMNNQPNNDNINDVHQQINTNSHQVLIPSLTVPNTDHIQPTCDEQISSIPLFSSNHSHDLIDHMPQYGSITEIHQSLPALTNSLTEFQTFSTSQINHTIYSGDTTNMSHPFQKSMPNTTKNGLAIVSHSAADMSSSVDQSLQASQSSIWEYEKQ